MVLLTYVDDYFNISPSLKSIDCLIALMQNGPEIFKLTDKGNVNKFLGIETTKLSKHTFKLLQPFLINRILSFLGLCNNKFDTDANSLPRLRSLKVFFIGIFLESLENMRGSIGLQSESSLISRILLALKFSWQLIKPLVSQISQYYPTRNQV